MNKKAFATAVASVAVAGTIAAPAMADETATTPVEQAQQAVEQAQQAVEQAAAQPTTQPQQDQVAAAHQAWRGTFRCRNGPEAVAEGPLFRPSRGQRGAAKPLLGPGTGSRRVESRGR